MYTTASGVQIPQGTDAFSPPAQFKNWADKAGTYENRVVVASVSAMNSLATPVRRTGVRAYVTGTKEEYIYDGTGWVPVVEDTGWVTVTQSANWTGSAVQYRRKNGIVFLRGIVSRTSGTDNIVTLPVGFRPTSNAVHPIATNAADNSVRLTVTTAGVVQQTPLASGSFMFLDGVSFIAEQ